MRIPRPKLDHAPEIHAAIIREHGTDSVRMAHTLRRLGWTLADAAWATANWPPEWLAAAIAHAKAARGIKLHSLSGDALAALRAELASSPPRKTPRITKNPKPKEK